MKITHKVYEDRVVLFGKNDRSWKLAVYANGVLFLCAYAYGDNIGVETLKQLVSYIRNPKRIRVFEGVREPKVTKVSFPEFRALCDNGVSAAVLLKMNINTNFIEQTTL
jgi:hypothetical protein